MGGQQPLDFLPSTPIFGGIHPEGLALLAAHLERRTFAAASRVVTEGEVARELFIIEEGELEVTRHGDEGEELLHPRKELILAVLRRGDCFGEMSLLDIMPRSATVWARTDVSLLVLHYRSLLELERRDPATFTLLVMNIAREVSRRLREAERLLVDLELAVLAGTPITRKVFDTWRRKRAPEPKR
jgi:CRP-like cAMP-binding protein